MIHSQFLKVGGADINKYNIADGVTVTTDPLDSHLSRGNAALQIEVYTGQISVTFQVALGTDKKFFDPVDVDDEDLSLVIASVIADKWVVYDTMLARAQRFKITATGNTNVSIRYIQQEY